MLGKTFATGSDLWPNRPVFQPKSIKRCNNLRRDIGDASLGVARTVEVKFVSNVVAKRLISCTVINHTSKQVKPSTSTPSVINYSSKLVKPSTPTPTIHRFYKISFTDELAPTVYVPLILYYSSPPDGPNGLDKNICDHLEDSLSNTLSEFYPLAGRFIRNQSLIDCNDQGVLYVLGKANVPVSYIVGLEHGLKPDVLNDFLPREIGEADDLNDPMLCIKVTTFECGGFAIGMLFSHRLSDMGTMCNFINNWAARSIGEYDNKEYSPIFNAPVNFPKRGLPELDLRLPRSSVNVKITAQRFVFSGEAISAMREKIGFDQNSGSRKPSKVQLVVALLWKALVRMDQVKNGQSKASFLIQPVGLRDKVVPPLPANSFGNFWGLATSQLTPGEGDKMELLEFFKILHGSIKKTAVDCAKILTHGEEGYGVIINPYLESNRKIGDNDVNFYLMTTWCKFSFYNADFGCGKPIWTSTGKLPGQNLVVTMDDHKGDGVEAWVHLDDKRMKELEQDSDIKTYATYIALASLI
ncbi:pelargonidin 3-O-(6-caffeoylglucoside) 5-O-(6-O-malonylglucoside) 4'''-malonyltransferase-like protein [Tanacetum coccineum]|uniref:Pelargonidin 3-O-(6-caffeoylglucoside) 5-O-(6-O-malonylglucoside) 4'''-malonyltransferase-like protein n=1 Tax=Tanacetum coccineum TaxID=301880 RepID=A0ABQ5FCB5_9ASTR